MKLFALVAAVLLLPQEKNEAEALLRKMEDKLLEAKTLQVRIEGSTRLPTGAATIKSSLLIGEATEVRMELEIKSPKETLNFLAVSDGSKLHTSSSKRRSFPADSPVNLSNKVVHAFTRAGTIFCGRLLEAVEEGQDSAGPREVPDLCNFKMGKKDKIGGRDAQRIHFTLKGPDNPVTVTLWIDVATTLPIKRELRGMQGVVDVTTVETFTELKLDEKIDPAKFELPK